MQFMDAKINLDPEFEVDMTIEESREYLKKALGILGEDYKAMIAKVMTNAGQTSHKTLVRALVILCDSS